ncbi:MAG: hypothetical protein HZA07_01735 [Nitrospirae bacterium]|nr:hypothetical protein [Nitrospirota bacterium]
MKKLFLVIIIGLLTDTVYADSHKELRDQSKCADCHLEKPQVLPSEICTFMNIPIKDTVTEMCTKCHEYGERSHPTDKAVDFPVPPDLPLKDGKITCVTCHYPHAKFESDRRYISTSLLGSLFSREKKHKTYFLRRPNTNGELCMACHEK